MPDTHPDQLPSPSPQPSKQGFLSLLALLISLIFVLLVVPIAESLPFATWALRAGLTAVLFASVSASGTRRHLFGMAVVVVVVAAPLSWATMFIDFPNLFLASCILDFLIFIAMAIAILVSVFRKHIATIHSIFGAISAYLLLGLAWSVLYWGIDHWNSESLRFNMRGELTPPSISTPLGTESLSEFIYFSFVTMSTLGYGDIVPISTTAQSLTWVQSVLGQFYNAILVAWLVSAIPRHPPAQKPK